MIPSIDVVTYTPEQERNVSYSLYCCFENIHTAGPDATPKKFHCYISYNKFRLWEADHVYQTIYSASGLTAISMQYIFPNYISVVAQISNSMGLNSFGSAINPKKQITRHMYVFS